MASVQRTVKVKFDGDAAGLSRAAKDGEREVDRFSKSVDKKFRKSGDDSGKNFNQSLKKWFSPSSLGKAGEAGGTVFGSGFLGALKTPVLGPAIAGSLLAAVAVAAPAAGSALAGGIVLAAGAGLAGLGLTFAAKSKTVQDTWKKTLSGMGADMTLLSKPFESTLVSIAGFAQRTFDKFKPSLEAVFKEMAPAVTKFVDQVSTGLEKLQPAVRPLAEAFDAVLGKLGPALQGAIGKTSDGLVKLAESVKANPEGLADLVGLVGSLTRESLNLVTALNNADGAIKRFENNPAVSKFLEKTGLSFGNVATIVGTNLVPGLSVAKTGIDLVAGSADKATQAVGLTGTATSYYTQGLNANQVASVLAGQAADSTSQRFRLQTAATDALFASMQKLTNNALGLAGSQINYQATVDAATASVKENGRNVDINTEKGRANKTSLLAVASATNAQTKAMRDSNVPLATITKTAEGARATFVKLAEKMGYSKTEANKLADAVIDIPPKKNVDVNVNTGNAAERVAAINAAIERLKSKAITITTNHIDRGSKSGVGGREAGNDPGRASGGLVFPNRSYLVGERGPETLQMGGSGGRIMNAEQTSQALAGGGSQPIVVENHIEIGGEVVRVVRTEIKANDRTTKRRSTAGVRAA